MPPQLPVCVHVSNNRPGGREGVGLSSSPVGRGNHKKENVHDTYPESICEVVSALWTNVVALEVDLGD